MIVVLKQNAQQESVKELLEWIEEQNIKINVIRGDQKTVLALVGDTARVDTDQIYSRGCVESISRIQEPYKEANRKFHPDDTIVKVGAEQIGGGTLKVVAGPCSVESEEQVTEIAKLVKASGATFLRGGAFKPRTSPYAFQGLHATGLTYLKKAREATGLPIVSEIMSIDHLDLFSDVDVIQVGARNMQNFELLKELGHCDKPILLKRGLANTIEEFLMSAEYVMAGGNRNVILCERGVRTFETMTRNTLDLSAVPLLKHLTHLPVMVDPSHATGIPYLVEPLSLAAIACGADAIMIEVHNDPKHALCDGAQALTPDQFDHTMKAIRRQAAFQNLVL